MPEITRDRWVSIEEVSNYLNVTRQTVLKWIATKNMPAVKMGKAWKLMINEVEAWVRSGGASN